ncbi:MAG: ATP-binding protein [Calditrichia bacterium]
MKKLLHSFYGKLSIVFLLLLILMGAALVLIVIRSSTHFLEEADQTLNLRLARDMAADFEPALRDSIDFKAIGHMIHYMMVINPKIEIYLLDETGRILAFFAEPEKKVKAKSVNVETVQSFIDGSAPMPILGIDPRNPQRKKPFSAAPIRYGQGKKGFIYIIIGGEQYDSAVSMIRNSFILRTALQSLFLVLLFTGLIGLILFAVLTRKLRLITAAVNRFEQGDLRQRIPVSSRDELGQLAAAFNKMADTIVSSMEKLKRNDALRRELVGNISHDLRSPLASIQGYLETIQLKGEKLEPAERDKYLNIILNNTTHLSQLVNELFELSRLDARQVKLRPEKFSLAELVQDMVMKYQPQAEKLQVKLKAEFDPNLPLVEADIGLIERALGNLVQNALRYTPAGGTVSILLQQQDSAIRVSVKDTGCGIPPEDLPFVFDRFYRVEKSRSRETGGTGLGLAITKKILELHHSQIRVESRVDEGTVFYFDLKPVSTPKSQMD